MAIYFRIAAHSLKNAVGAGVITTMFDNMDRALSYKSGLMEQHGYTDDEITILATDKEGRPIQM